MRSASAIAGADTAVPGLTSLNPPGNIATWQLGGVESILNMWRKDERRKLRNRRYLELDSSHIGFYDVAAESILSL